jgi:hypothetical protein
MKNLKSHSKDMLIIKLQDFSSLGIFYNAFLYEEETLTWFLTDSVEMQTDSGTLKNKYFYKLD